MMKSFKSYLTEKQSQHDDLLLVLRGEIKLDMDTACKIWEDCGKRSTFRHVTSKDGAEYLINNTNKNLAISAFKVSSHLRGVETEGEVVLVVDARYKLWFPEDAYTYIGSGGKRWLSMTTDGFRDITKGTAFVREYTSALYDLILTNKRLMNFVDDYDYTLKQTSDFNNKSAFMDRFSLYDPNLSTSAEMLIYQYVQVHSDWKFVQKALALQKKLLDKHSTAIKANLMKLWTSARTPHSALRTRYKNKWSMDEAIVDDIKVKYIIFKGTGFELYMEDLNNKLKIYEEKNPDGPPLTRKNIPKLTDGLYEGYLDEGFALKEPDEPMRASGTIFVPRELRLPFKFIDRENKTKGISFTFMRNEQQILKLDQLKRYKYAWEFLENEYNIVRSGKFLKKVK
jgi:hypothetical protein